MPQINTQIRKMNPVTLNTNLFNIVSMADMMMGMMCMMAKPPCRD